MGNTIGTTVTFGKNAQDQYIRNKVENQVVADMTVTYNPTTGLVIFNLYNENKELITQRYLEIPGFARMVTGITFDSSTANLLLQFADGTTSQCSLAALEDYADSAVAAEATLRSNADTALQAAINAKADKATTLAGYGITDAYTKSDVYTKAEVDGLFDDFEDEMSEIIEPLLDGVLPVHDPVAQGYLDIIPEEVDDPDGLHEFEAGIGIGDSGFIFESTIVSTVAGHNYNALSQEDWDYLRNNREYIISNGGPSPYFEYYDEWYEPVTEDDNGD